MKNRKLISKSAGVAMAVLMAAGNIAPVFAATAPSANDKATVTVTNVEDGATVVAYQVVKGDYNASGLVGYKACGVSIADIEKPTNEEVLALVNAINADTANATYAANTLTGDKASGYTADLPAGEYIVLVTPGNAADMKVYNPMIVSAHYTNANDAASIQGGTVDSEGHFNGNAPAFAKSSTPTIDKKIVKTVNDETKLVPGDTASADGTKSSAADTLKFQIDSTLPDYRTAVTTKEADGTATTTYGTVFDGVEYSISDVLEKDVFGAISDIKVYAVTKGEGDNAADVETELTVTNDYTVDTADKEDGSHAFKVSFTADYLQKHPNEKVRIAYNSKLLDTQKNQNFAENVNKATLTYSNSPDDAQSKRTVDKYTYHYTFGIDALVDGENADEKATHEFNKVTAANGTYTDGTSDKALAGATFTLYSDEACTPDKAIQGNDGNAITSVSDAGGHFGFTGLNVGTYYVKETQAPNGYTLNNTVYKFDIAATIDEANGTMTSYSITTTKKGAGETSFSAAGSAVYNNTAEIQADGSVENVIVSTVTPMEVVDTKLSVLPSTGGEGRKVMYICAAAAMVTGIAVVIERNKKKA